MRRGTVTDNPWHDLPEHLPFVHPEDKEDVDAYNKKKGRRHDHFLHLEFIPEPFVGNPHAQLVLLGNNPGVARDKRKAAHRLKPAFATRMRDNLVHRLPDRFPFLFFDPGIIPSEQRWWDYKLTHVIDEFEDTERAKEILGRNILAVEFFPYISHRFGHGKLSLSTQQYSFGLVRHAVERDAVIVLTRGETRWKKAVPELNGYPHLVHLKQVQRAPISRRNCCGNGWELIQEYVRNITVT
jgi:hypothetical protein